MPTKLYEKGSLTATEMVLLVLTWIAEIAMILGPVVNDKFYDRAGFWPAFIGFFCATWLSRVLLTGGE